MRILNAASRIRVNAPGPGGKGRANADGPDHPLTGDGVEATDSSAFDGAGTAGVGRSGTVFTATANASARRVRRRHTPLRSAKFLTAARTAVVVALASLSLAACVGQHSAGPSETASTAGQHSSSPAGSVASPIAATPLSLPLVGDGAPEIGAPVANVIDHRGAADLGTMTVRGTLVIELSCVGGGSIEILGVRHSGCGTAVTTLRVPEPKSQVVHLHVTAPATMVWSMLIGEVSS